MPTINDLLAFGLSGSQNMLKRYLADLSPQEYLHRPTPKANCAAWTVGHLAMTDRYALKLLGVPLPELTEGFDKRFSRDERSDDLVRGAERDAFRDEVLR